MTLSCVEVKPLIFLDLTWYFRPSPPLQRPQLNIKILSIPVILLDPIKALFDHSRQVSEKLVALTDVG